MQVITRYNYKFNFNSSIGGLSKTEQGLSQPLSVLVKRYQSGREVPHLLGNISSNPFGSSFDSDLIDKYKSFTDLQSQMDKLKASVNNTAQA